MFNRTLRVDVVKKTKQQPVENDQLELSFEEKATIVTNHLERGIKKVGIAVCAYVVLDTVRKAVVAAVQNY